MSTRMIALRTRPIAARCLALAALSVTYFLTGCEASNTTLHGKTDAGQSGGQDAGHSGTGGSSGTGGNTSLPRNACAEAGGSCVAVAPGSCPGVTLSSLSCGSGIGSICCMPGGAGGTGGAGGSAGRGGNSGSGGSTGRGGASGSGGTNGNGGASGTGGNTSVPVTTCTEAGGTCVGVFPGSCASGTMNPSLSCGSGVGSACCISGGGGGRGGNSGAAGQGGHAACGANGQGGTGGRGTEPQAAACEKAGGICMEQGTCVSQGGTVAAESPAGCQFSDAPAECCITPAPKPNPTTCAEAGGTCASISGCLMAGGYLTATNYACSFPVSCCVPNATCGAPTIECCGDGVRYNAACQGGQFVCVVGSPVPRGTCKI